MEACPRRKTNRRQFLAGKSATVALGDVVDTWLGAADAPAQAERSVARRIFAGVFTAGDGLRVRHFS